MFTIADSSENSPVKYYLRREARRDILMDMF